MAEVKEKKTPPVGVSKAAQGVDVYAGFNTYSNEANPNDFNTREKTRTYADQIEAMERSDPKLMGLLQTRSMALLGLKRTISGEGEAADFVRDNFARLPNFDWTLYEIHDGTKVGFAVLEVVWEVLNNKFVIDKLLARSPDKFAFSKDWDLKLLTRDKPTGYKVSEDKFKVFTFMGKYGNRYGSSLLQKIYWYWYFKKYSTTFWGIYVEKFGVPPVLAKQPPGGGTKEDRATVDSFIKNLKTSTGIRYPDGWAIELLDIAKSGKGISTHKEFIEYLDESMAVAILGQPLTSGTGAGGTKTNALGSIHELIRQDILKADISFIESYVNDQIIRPLVDYNFSNVKEYPKWQILIEQPINKREMVEVIDKIVRLGHKGISIQYLNSLFGFPEVKPGDEVIELPEVVTRDNKALNNAIEKSYIADLKNIT